MTNKQKPSWADYVNLGYNIQHSSDITELKKSVAQFTRDLQSDMRLLQNRIDGIDDELDIAKKILFKQKAESISKNIVFTISQAYKRLNSIENTLDRYILMKSIFESLGQSHELIDDLQDFKDKELASAILSNFSNAFKLVNEQISDDELKLFTEYVNAKKRIVLVDTELYNIDEQKRKLKYAIEQSIVRNSDFANKEKSPVLPPASSKQKIPENISSSKGCLGCLIFLVLVISVLALISASYDTHILVLLTLYVTILLLLLIIILNLLKPSVKKELLIDKSVSTELKDKEYKARIELSELDSKCESIQTEKEKCEQLVEDFENTRPAFIESEEKRLIERIRSVMNELSEIRNQLRRSG